MNTSPDHISSSESLIDQVEKLTLMSDTVLAGLDLASELAVELHPVSSSSEYTLPEYVLDPSIRLPDTWNILGRPSALTISFEQTLPSEPVDIRIDADFEGWNTYLFRKGNVGHDTSFLGYATRRASHTSADPDTDPFPIQATGEEIRALIDSVLHLTYTPPVEETIADFHKPDIAEAIQSILRETLNAERLEKRTYEIIADGEQYEVVCEWENDDTTAVEIIRIVRDDLVIVDGIPQTVDEREIATIEVGNFNQSISFVDSESDVSESRMATSAQVTDLSRRIAAIRAALGRPELELLDTDEMEDDYSFVSEESGDSQD